MECERLVEGVTDGPSKGSFFLSKRQCKKCNREQIFRWRLIFAISCMHRDFLRAAFYLRKASLERATLGQIRYANTFCMGKEKIRKCKKKKVCSTPSPVIGGERNCCDLATTSPADTDIGYRITVVKGVQCG